MSQDTRKDKRAKVVSLNVRYKSATVDEFIENHSHDVSKGGLFVKTPTPFPPGTLLKFEIRLDAFNALNHTQFDGINTTLNVTSLTNSTATNLADSKVIVNANGTINRAPLTGFGAVTSVRPPRNMQLSARFQF